MLHHSRTLYLCNRTVLPGAAMLPCLHVDARAYPIQSHAPNRSAQTL
jgi:hypothetical protein